MASVDVVKIEMKESLYRFGVSSWEVKSMEDICTKFGSKFLEGNQDNVPLGSPRKVQLSEMTSSFPSRYSSDEPMPIRLSYGANYLAQPRWSVDATFAHNNISWIGKYPHLKSASATPSIWSVGPLPADDVIQPPPGLEDIVVLPEEGRSSSTERSIDKADSNRSDKSDAGVKCTKHGLHVCNRMFGGRKCQKADCLTKSSLCHEEKCCANRVRPRPTASEKQAAKSMARMAKAELDNLEITMVSKRLNETERGLGYKLKALEVLQQYPEPWNLSADRRACVIRELRNAESDASSAFRVRELAGKTLQKWDSESLCMSCK